MGQLNLTSLAKHGPCDKTSAEKRQGPVPDESPHLIFGLVEDFVGRPQGAQHILARITKVHATLKYPHLGIG